jgi:hypothetical protein
MRDGGKRAWLPLLGVFVLVMALCSGSATLVAGPNIGWSVGVTFLAMLVGFALVCAVGAVILGRRQDKHDPDDVDA